MEGGALFRVRTEARARVLAEMSKIILHKNEVGGYAYNDATTLITQIERVLERETYEESSDGMKGLLSTTHNTLNRYKATIAIKRKDILRESKEEAALLSASAGATIAPEITTNSDAQDEADRQNTFRLAAVGAKEGIAEGITALVGKDITNPILRTSDGSDFRSVDGYQLHQLITAISEGAERPEAANIRKQFVNVAGTVFDWRETVTTNVERFATAAAKTQGYGVHVHEDLKAIVILANTEWAAQQTWGSEISVAYRKIVAKYRYNHTHDATSIRDIVRILTDADEARDRRRAKAPGELADMVDQGMTRLQQLVLDQPSVQYKSDSSSSAESAYAATTTDSEDTSDRRRGRRKKKERKPRRRSPSPSTSRSPSPPPRRSKHRSSSRPKKKEEKRETNPTGCKYCAKYKGNGFAHLPPKSIPHEKCNYNKKWKGWRPEWVCTKMGIKYRTYDECESE